MNSVLPAVMEGPSGDTRTLPRTSAVGADDTGVTELDALDGRLVPTAFVAVTMKT